MKKIIVLLLLCAHVCVAQNLVPNPSFEDTVSCPFGTNQLFKATGWQSFRNTPDYFNSCNSTQVGVPVNLYDYQNAHTGNSYIGFATFALSNPIFREWAATQLIQQLIVGQKYFVNFYISRAVNNQTGFNINVASNKIGVRFSTIPYLNGNQLPLTCYAQVLSDSVIIDTLNWTKISGSFIADSAYNYLVIGNFCDSSSTSFSAFTSTSNIAYYFLDDISVSTDSITGIEVTLHTYSSQIYTSIIDDKIHLNGDGIKSVEIYNLMGEMVYEIKNHKEEKEIEIIGLRKGFYILRLKINNKYMTKKLFKN